MWTKTVILVLLLAAAEVSSFSSPPFSTASNANRFALQETAGNDVAEPQADKTSSMILPRSYSEMVKEMSSAMRDAYDQGKKRQLIRVLLPRDASSEKLLVQNEGILDVEDSQNIVLVPPDESWQGGIMQLYYSAAPTCIDALRLFTKTDSGVPPRIEEDRSVDESGVDGVGLIKADLGNEKASCFVQPSQETIEDHLDDAVKNSGLVVLLNPQWRVTGDWFDQVSASDGGFFGQVASFLGGNGNTLKALDKLSFEGVYSFEGYVCRGYNVRMVKRFDSDYVVFCEGQGYSYEKVGTKPSRPNYQEVEQMLVDRGYGFKFAENLSQ